MESTLLSAMSLRRTSKGLNSCSSLLKQNLHKNQNLDKQINSFPIPEENLQRIPPKFPKNTAKNTQKFPKKFKNCQKIAKKFPRF